MTRRNYLALLAGTALLVIWYFTGGREELRWWWVVRQAASTGWDISQAYHMKFKPWLPLCLISGSLLLLAGLAVKIYDIIRAFRNAKRG
jgi:hypothetical protein